LVERLLVQREQTMAIYSTLLFAGGDFRPARPNSGHGCKESE
tara:strand:+ start:3160 stop:3285 length:126 start_codon:yes stop_codon:yes gene_type:complete